MKFIPDLPEYAEWTGSDHWKDHLNGHGDLAYRAVDPSCPRCIVQPMMDVIHEAVWHHGICIAETWELQDGYGIVGYVPPQGWDWSGIRDSSPAAIQRMYHAVIDGLHRQVFEARLTDIERSIDEIKGVRS